MYFVHDNSCLRQLPRQNAVILRLHARLPGAAANNGDAAVRDAAGRDAAGRDAAGRDAAGRDAAGRDAAGPSTGPSAGSSHKEARERERESHISKFP